MCFWKIDSKVVCRIWSIDIHWVVSLHVPLLLGTGTMHDIPTTGWWLISTSCTKSAVKKSSCDRGVTERRWVGRWDVAKVVMLRRWRLSKNECVFSFSSAIFEVSCGIMLTFRLFFLWDSWIITYTDLQGTFPFLCGDSFLTFDALEFHRKRNRPWHRAFTLTSRIEWCYFPCWDVHGI